MTKATQDILAEREKQRGRWGDQHDDTHTDGSLAECASYLADPHNLDGGGCIDLGDPDEVEEAGWGVQLLVKHRDDRRQQLVIAAALILAEIERIDRGTP